MLSLLDPIEIENIVVFRDDVEAQKFYLLPDQPVIPTDQEGNPEFLFIKYIKDVSATPDTGASLGGGILQFRSALTIKPERVAKIKDALKARLEQEKASGKNPLKLPITSTEPLLAAPIWTGGKVSLGTFKVSDTGLVRYATDGAPVDLAGDLGASITLELDDTGVEIFWSSFQSYKEKQIPIMLTYQLTYKARVSASMTIHAERKVVHQKILQRARPYQLLLGPMRYVPIAMSQPFVMANLSALATQFRRPVAAFVPRLEVNEVIQQSIANNDIKVNITTDESGQAEGGSSIRDALLKMATELLADRIVPALFGENASKPGATDAAPDRPSVDLVEVKPDTPSDSTLTFDFTFDQQSTIERQINPNGPVQVLINSDVALANCFKELRLTDGFFATMTVSATTLGVNFQEDGIEGVHVFFDYTQTDDADPRKPVVSRKKDETLTSEKDVIRWKFDLARTAKGSHKQAYKYKTKVFYREGPPSESAWITSTDQKLAITPHAMGALRVEAVLTAPEGTVNSAKVQLEHTAPSGKTYSASLELSPKDPRKTWFQYTGELTERDNDINPPEYRCRVAYQLEGGEIVTAWQKSTTKTLEIPSPFKKILTFTLRPQGSFDGVRDITGDLIYNDSAHGYSLSIPFQLASPTAVATLKAPIMEGGPETATLNASINRADGTSTTLPVQTISPGSVLVGRQPFNVTIRMDLIDFDQSVQLATVQMIYSDPANSVSEKKTFTFNKASRGPESWTFNRAPGGTDKYDVNVQFIAYDRSKNAAYQFRAVDKDLLLIDSTGALL